MRQSTQTLSMLAVCCALLADQSGLQAAEPLPNMGSRGRLIRTIRPYRDVNGAAIPGFALVVKLMQRQKQWNHDAYFD